MSSFISEDTWLKKLITLLFLWFLSSCTSPGYYERLECLLSENDKSINSVSYVVVINLDACSSCADHIRSFVSGSQDLVSVVVILTSSSSKKINVTLSGIEAGNVIRDLEMKSVYTYALVNSKPHVYFIENERVKRKEVLVTDLDQNALYDF